MIIPIMEVLVTSRQNQHHPGPKHVCLPLRPLPIAQFLHKILAQRPQILANSAEQVLRSHHDALAAFCDAVAFIRFIASCDNAFSDKELCRTKYVVKARVR